LFLQGVLHGCCFYKVLYKDLKQLLQGFHKASTKLSQGVYKAFKRFLQGFHTCVYSVFYKGVAMFLTRLKTLCPSG
jgi:hypothetical protein